jgi:hypothetical protein
MYGDKEERIYKINGFGNRKDRKVFFAETAKN